MALSPTGVLPGSPGSQVTESGSAQPPLDERAPSRVSERHPLGSAALQRLGFRWLGWLRLGLSAGLLGFRLGFRLDFGFGLIWVGFWFGLI